jgi:hypothetical protein
VEWLSEKWAKKLSGECNLDPNFLKRVLEELSESCLGDSLSSQKLIEELTLKCSLTKDELSKFIAEVSKNCPVDAKKLYNAIRDAGDQKDAAFRSIPLTRTKPV